MVVLILIFLETTPKLFFIVAAPFYSSPIFYVFEIAFYLLFILCYNLSDYFSYNYF